MSAWMTSGKARLNARQNRTFEKRAQQRARVMNAGNVTNNSSVPHRILRERGHPNVSYHHPGDPNHHRGGHSNRGTKRHRSSHIEIISGDAAKAKYSPNNPIRRRGVVATARRVHHSHSLDQHNHWQSQHSHPHPHPPTGEYPQHAPPPYHPNSHYDHHYQQHPKHHPHQYPALTGEENFQTYFSRRDHWERYQNAKYNRKAPFVPPISSNMAYDYKTARWMPLPPQSPYESPSDPIKEAQVYPSAHEPLLGNYHHPQEHYPSQPSRHPKPPFQDKRPPHYQHQANAWESNHDKNDKLTHHPTPPFQDKQPAHYKHRATSEWESNRSSKHDEDDYLYYGDETADKLQAATSFELPSESDENVLVGPHHSSPQHSYHNMDGGAAQATMGHHLHKSYTDSDWHGDTQPPAEHPHLQDAFNNHHQFQQEPPVDSDDFPTVKYSKSDVEPWEVDGHQHFQIERSNTWSPGSAAEPRSFTLTSSSRGRRIPRYSPPRLPYSPPRLPEGLQRFQKKRRTLSPARLLDDEDKKDGEEVEALTQGPRLFNNGVQINEDGTPLFVPADTTLSE